MTDRMQRWLKATAMSALAVGAAMAWMAPATCRGDTPTTTSAPTSKPAGKGGRIIRLPGIRVDLDARRIVVDSEVCNRQCDLELLLCSKGGKQHESILWTDAKASHLHAALLALGLHRGMPAEWVGPAEGGSFLPRGPKVKISLRWKAKGAGNGAAKARTVSPSEWIEKRDKKSKVALPSEWVFVGSVTTVDGRYMADHPEGDQIICVSNHPGAVLDVPFDSSQDVERWLFRTKTQAIPPLGTPVEIIIEPVKDAAKSPYARALLELAPDGRMRIEGKGIRPDELEAWAGKFSKAHSKAVVVIRSAGRTPVIDVEKAKMHLRRGWVWGTRQEVVGPQGWYLPRTKTQVAEEMVEWRERFATPKDFTEPPDKRAREAIVDIQRQLAELKARQRLWEAYARRLEEMAKRYEDASTARETATQPAE